MRQRGSMYVPKQRRCLQKLCGRRRGAGSDILLGGRILLVCAVISLKQGTVQKKTGDCPQVSRCRKLSISYKHVVF